MTDSNATHEATRLTWTPLRAFTAGLMLVTLALVAGIGEFEDQTNERLQSQILVTELESDLAELDLAQTELVLGGDPEWIPEIIDEHEDLIESTGDLETVNDQDVHLVPLRTTIDALGVALLAQIEAFEAGDTEQVLALQEGVDAAFEDFDEAVETASDDYEAGSARWDRYFDLGLIAAVVLGWLAILALARRYAVARRLARDEIEASREKFQTLAEAAFEGVAVVLEGRVVEAGDAFANLLGYEPGQVDGLSVVDLVTAEAGEVMRSAVTAHSERSFEATGLRADGTHVTLEVRTRPGTYRGEEVRIVAIRDVTERKALEQRLQHQAMHDTLTGLANRALFSDRLEHALHRSSRHDSSTVAVLFFDLDDFKVVNDSLGHAAGDLVLTAVAERLRGALRPVDTVARLGGDEFAVLIEDVADDAAVIETAQRLADVLRAEPVALPEGGRAAAVASIGIAFADAGVDTPSDVLQRADLAMYEAKAQGKGRATVFQPGMESRARERLVLVNDLRHALERGELDVHYQPQVDVTGTRLRGFEALLRWNHPSRDRVGPDQFVPIAEQSGLIVPIGQWVLRTACAQLAEWRATRPAAEQLSMSVNVSVRQLNEVGLADQFVDIVRSAGLTPHDVVLEITESVLLNETATVRSALEELREHGFRLAIDDFGTGYSSLSYLQRFSSDYLKIDKSFIDGLGRTREADNIISTIINLARTLDMQCIAEGVEDHEQRDHLRELGCDFAQGFFFHRPMPAVDVLGLLDGDDEQPVGEGTPEPSVA